MRKFLAGTLLALLLLGAYSAYDFYQSIFRLTPNQVAKTICQTIPRYQKITDCQLRPGDILIRRYITSRTKALDQYLHLYFTHSAFYIGNDYIVEASGKEQRPEDEIRVTRLSTSDWENSDIENFVIIRPKNYEGKLDKIISNLKTIAADPNYRFGLPIQGGKRTTCAELILKEIITEKVIQEPKVPKIITPDYLFWLAVNNSDNFEIIGH